MNKNIAQSPILVTGAHRSGTTWVGKMLSLAPDIAYIHEPFSPHHRKGICRAEFEYWFYYIHPKSSANFLPSINDTIHFNYNVKEELKDIHSMKDFFRMKIGTKHLNNQYLIVFCNPFFLNR